MGVSGFTPMLTAEGYVAIKELNGDIATVWNGNVWSTAQVYRAGVRQQLYRVEISDGTYIDCSADHKFSIRGEDGSYYPCTAGSLKTGDVTECATRLPIISKISPISRITCDLQPAPEPTDMTIPFKESLHSRLGWLSEKAQVSKTCCYISAKDLRWVREVQLMAHTVGLRPSISKVWWRGFDLRFTGSEPSTLGINLTANPTNEEAPPLSVAVVYKLNGFADTFCFNEPLLKRGIFNGVYTGT